MNDMDIDSSSLARELGDYETDNPDVHTDYGEDFSVGDDLSSQRYDGNGDISARDNIKNKTSYLFNLAAAYEAKGNNAKACGYYKQVVSDPKYKAAVEYKINNVLKCK